MKIHGKSGFNEQPFSPPLSKLSQGFFGRMFRNLEPFRPPGRTEDDINQFFRELAQTMVEGEGDSGDNRTIPAAYTYLGQFINHDITFDPASSLERLNDPERLVNFRSPRFDLDCLYGSGPDDNPYLYHQNRFGYLLTGKGRVIDDRDDAQIVSDRPSEEDDLIRNDQGVAIIGDPRNDENLIVSQLQLAFIKFHNKMMEHVASERNMSGSSLFIFTQRLVRWTYQYMVIHDFLKRLAGRDVVDSLLPDKSNPTTVRLRFYSYENNPFIPVEFSTAAYRAGHSMVRQAYVLNDILHEMRQNKPVPIFVSGAAKPLEDARGGRPLPQAWSVQWDRFVRIRDSADPQWTRLIDTKLSKALNVLPGHPEGENNLAFLDLKRGFTMQLPSGQAVARAMGIEPLAPTRSDCDDPLWFYILKEAKEEQRGERLGRVGSSIVAEVFIGLLAGDPLSYINIDPLWEPTIPVLEDADANTQARIQLADILHFAGVPIRKANLNFGTIWLHSPRGTEGNQWPA